MKQKIPHVLLWELILFKLNRPPPYEGSWKQADQDFTNTPINNNSWIYLRFHCFHFRDFDLEVKATEIFEDILPFSGEKYGRGKRKITKIYENISHKNCSSAFL